nr:MAG TPA: hypothetical protein [Caudoviricetes sp.]
MKNMRTMKSIRVTERMKAVMQVVAVALVLLWCGFGMLRAILQRVDAIVVIGFGVGTWAAWMLLRMSIEEMREARKEETDGK